MDDYHQHRPELRRYKWPAPAAYQPKSRPKVKLNGKKIKVRLPHEIVVLLPPQFCTPHYLTQPFENLPILLKLFLIDPRCHYCERKLHYEECTIDHKVPRCRGGTKNWGNALLACFVCNNAKNDMDYELFVSKFITVDGKKYFIHPTGRN